MDKEIGEISNEDVIKIRLRDFILQPMIPNQVRIFCPELGQTYNITSEPTQHAIGHRSGGRVQANWYIQDNYIIAKGIEVTDTRVIDQVYTFRMEEVTTSQRAYTKFKFTN